MAAQRESAGDDRLGGNERRDRGEGDKGVKPPVRHKPVERVFERRRVSKQQRALSEIVQQQRREDKAEPGAARRGGRNAPYRHRAPRRRSPRETPRPASENRARDA